MLVKRYRFFPGFFTADFFAPFFFIGVGAEEWSTFGLPGENVRSTGGGPGNT